MRLSVYCSILVSLFFSLTADVYSSQPPNAEEWKHLRTITPEGYVCSRTDEPLTLDGRLDESSWYAAPWTNSFVDIMGALKPVPRFQTRVKMLWDDTYLYIGAYLEEPHVWGTMLFPDQVMFYENDFEMFIDANSDSHEYLEFEMSPLGALWDLSFERPYKDSSGLSHVWNMPGAIVRVWVDGTLNNPRDIDRGWSVEFALPWSSLAWRAHCSCPPNDGDTWRMNFYRAEYDPEIITSDRAPASIKNNAYKSFDMTVEGRVPDQWVWSPQGMENIHLPEMWGYVQFSTDAPGMAKYRPDPLIEGRRTLHDIYYAQRYFRDANKRYATSIEELGIDFSENKAITGTPVIETTDKGYIAHITAVLPDGKTQKMSIRYDALVTVEKE